MSAMDVCAWYRCNVPGQELIKRGYDVALTDQLNEQEILAADVVVFLRHHSREALRLMKAAKKAGKRVVYDIDDMLWELDPENPHHAYWSRPDVVKGLEACIRAADLVTTTTETLAKPLRGRNAHVKVLPNMLPREIWPYTGAKPQSDEHVIIGWAGGTSHWQDLEVLGDTVYNILDRYEKAWFVFCGMERVPFELRDRLVVIPGVPITEFSEVLRTFDIGLAPLNDTKFNRCKSDLRALEYSAVGIPVVASDMDSFAAFVREGESGLLVKSPAQWEDALGRLIEDRELRERMGGRSFEEAERRFIENTVGLWEEAYGLETSGATPGGLSSSESPAAVIGRRGAGKIGLGITTYNRPAYFKQSFQAVLDVLGGSVDCLFVYNDGSDAEHQAAYQALYERLGSECTVFHADENRGVAHAKNTLFAAMLDAGCDYIFVGEDDIVPLTPDAINGYVRACETTGIEHLNFAHHGPLNKMPVAVTPPLAFWGDSVGAWSFYTRDCLLRAGLMDEGFRNAWEHVEHTNRIAALHLTSPFWYFADALGSEGWLKEIPGSIDESAIRPRDDWRENIDAGMSHWIQKDGQGLPPRPMVRMERPWVW